MINTKVFKVVLLSDFRSVQMSRTRLICDILTNNPIVCVSPSALHLLDIPVPSSDFLLTSWSSEDRLGLINIMAGNTLPKGAIPWSHNYAGHQFGLFAGQLGDGRAISLGEHQNAEGATLEIQLKGAGSTPYSRMGDGFAVLRSSIREFLASEHFHALGIPTSRAAALVTTGQPVHREELEPGAIVARLAPSWLRFGSFEVFAMHGDLQNLARLANYAIHHHFPEAKGTVIGMLEAIAERTAFLVSQWNLVAWGHGVLNTDNMSLLGLTIDFGPYSFYDTYEPDHIFNHSDQGGRYTLRNQKSIAEWNIAKLCTVLAELIGRELKGQSCDEVVTLKDFGTMEERVENATFSKDVIAGLLEKFNLSFDKYFQEGMGKVQYFFVYKKTM
jgi:uncharacterized protein YdiU (UPF0061 family)